MDYAVGSDYIPLNNSTSVHISDLILPGERAIRAELWPFSLWDWNLEIISPPQLLTHREKCLHCCLPGHQPGMAWGWSWQPCAWSSHHHYLHIVFRNLFVFFCLLVCLFLIKVVVMFVPRSAVTPECQAACSLPPLQLLPVLRMPLAPRLPVWESWVSTDGESLTPVYLVA